MNSKFSLLISFFFLFSNVNNALDITKLFEKYPDFSKFSSYLTQTKLTTDINSRQTITILAVGNGNIAPLSGKPVDVLRKILSLHIILDYYDEKKLQTMQDKSTLLTTLFQVSGQATGQKGFLKVTDTSGGSVAFGLAGAGSAPSANLVNSIHDEPYNISILQISGILAPGGSDAAASPSSSLSTAPTASPTKSPTTTTTTGTSATATTGASATGTSGTGATTPTSAPTTAPGTSTPTSAIHSTNPSTASAVSPSGASAASASGASAASASGASAASPSGASAASASGASAASPSGASAAAADISPSTHPSTASAAPGTAEDDADSGADAPSNAAVPASTEADTPDAAPDSPPGPPLGSPPMPAAPTADAPAPAADSAAPGTTLLSHRRVLMIIVPSVIYILFA